MLFDTSYHDKKIERQINQSVGPVFSFKERWKLGGIGSKRLTIADITDDYKKYLNEEHYQSKANIELRPKGIIVHFRYKLEEYSWVMPFDDLTLKNESNLVLTAGDKFIAFEEKLEERFLQKFDKIRDRLK